MQLQGNKKLILLISGVGAGMLLLLIAGIYMVLTKPKSKQTAHKTASSKTAASPTDDSADNSQAAPTTPSPSPAASNNGGTAAPPSSPAKKPWFKLILDHASQAGNQVEVVAKVEGTTTGTCELTLSRAGMPSLKRTVDIRTDQFKVTTCGFVVSSASIYSSGKWNVRMVAKVGAVTSDPMTTTMDISH